MSAHSESQFRSDARVDELFPSVYGELRGLAAAYMARQSSGQTLQATALVHEAFVRLSKAGTCQWNNQGHFFRTAAEAMRQVLIDRARNKQRLKRGGEWTRVSLEGLDIASEADSSTVLAVDSALTKLSELDATKAEIVQLRFFAGLTVEETAKALNMSTATVKRHWSFARVWLFKFLSEG